MLTSTGNISDAWMKKLEIFLGYTKDEIMNHFYKLKKRNTLFGEEISLEKEKNAVQLVDILYTEKVKGIIFRCFKIICNEKFSKLNYVSFHDGDKQ